MYSIMLIGVVFSFVLVYGFLKARSTFSSPKRTFSKPKPIILNTTWTSVVILSLVAFEVLLNGMALMAYNSGWWNLALFETGCIFIVFGILAHVYRSYDPKNDIVKEASSSPAPSAPTPTASNAADQKN